MHRKLKTIVHNDYKVMKLESLKNGSNFVREKGTNSVTYYYKNSSLNAMVIIRM